MYFTQTLSFGVPTKNTQIQIKKSRSHNLQDINWDSAISVVTNYSPKNSEFKSQQSQTFFSSAKYPNYCQVPHTLLFKFWMPTLLNFKTILYKNVCIYTFHSLSKLLWWCIKKLQRTTVHSWIIPIAILLVRSVCTNQKHFMCSGCR